jgi:cysteine desulfurase
MDFVYLDNNATTPLLPEVWEAMRPYFFVESGNAASSHQAGRRARQALEDARDKVASLLDAHPDEVIFTSGATEANNLAIFGLSGPDPGAILSSAIEHPCVTEPIQRLVETGFRLVNLAVDRTGVIQVPAEIAKPTRLVAVMLANHETGAIQPVAALVERVAGRAPVHCDAAAAAGKIPVSFRRLGVSTLAISAHKFHGPKGIGALVVKRGTRLRPLFWGGHQQQGRRPGTEPVPLAVGMAAALESAIRNHEANDDRVRRLRACLLSGLEREAAPIVLNGPEAGGIPHTINISFPGCKSDALLMALDLAGVACSTGSACSSGSLLPSPVLRAMQVPPEILGSAMRFSISSLLSEEKVSSAAARISLTVNKLRDTSRSR